MWTYIYRNFYVWKNRFAFYIGMYLIAPALTMYGLSVNFKDIDGLSGYQTYIIPGFMAYSAILSAFFSTTYGCFTKIEHQGTYQSILATTVTLHQIILGDMIWNSIRSSIVGISVGISAIILFGEPTFSSIFLSIPIMALGAISAGAMGLAVLSISKSYDDLAVFESVIAALFIFSGVFTFVEKFPVILQYTAQFFPLYHTIELLRAPSQPLFNIAVLILIALVCYIFAYHFLRKRLLT